jgi:hypothetical protein
MSRRSETRPQRAAARRQDLLHQAVRRHEEDGDAAVGERLADSADRMTLADAGQAEGQDMGGVVENVALGDLVEAPDQ